MHSMPILIVSNVEARKDIQDIYTRSNRELRVNWS